MQRIPRLAFQICLVAMVVVPIRPDLGLVQIQSPKQPRIEGQSGVVVNIKFHSAALEGNKLGDPADQNVAIYLPPAYRTAVSKRYPTLYLLHGFNGNPGQWTTNGYQGMSLQKTMDALISAREIQDMIVVVPNGDNAYLGSFYTNSSASGNWEDYIVRDLIPYVDREYRTISSAESRGVTGHSMGGYGAILFGMKHPDVFAAVYAMSPCCLAMEADLTSQNKVWKKVLQVKEKADIVKNPQTYDDFYLDAFVALAAAFSPNPDQEPFFVDFPYEERNGGIVRREPAWSKWQAKMLVGMEPQYKANLARLHGLGLDYGFQDDFPHIPLGVRMLSTQLAKDAIPHEVASYTGDHGDHIRERFETIALPFFSRILKGSQ